MSNFKKELLKGAKNIGIGLLLMGFGGLAIHQGDKMSRDACKKIAEDVSKKYDEKKDADLNQQWSKI